MCFCSDRCARAVTDEFEREVALSGSALEPPPRPRRRRARGAGAAHETTPARLYRVALERNGAVSRWLRAKPRWRTLKHYPKHGAALRDVFDSMVDMLNVDTAVLYAATVMDEIPKRQHRYALPRTIRWRQAGASTSGTAIYNARALYKKFGGSRPPVLARGTERWLVKIRDAALTLF
jgi:hypothetical protein